MRIPALLVTGAIGAGKTSYITRLLAERPHGARWAVLVNDFGEATLQKIAAGNAVLVREVAGCICCSAQVSLRTATVALLRERPERLLIEASAAAHPGAIVAVLREPGIASALMLEGTTCVVDPVQAIDARYATLELYREQVKAADVVVLTKGDVRSKGDRSAAREALLAMGAASVVDA
jgi:G3E family GTPase